jgi:hypothetical protein
VNPTEGVLGEAWALYKAHWRHLLTIAFVVYLAVALIGIVLSAIFEDWIAGLLAFGVTLVALFWVQGALVKAVEDVRDGRPDMTLGETFERVRPRLSSILVGGILAGIGVFVGLLLLIVPGLVLMTWWVLIIPVIVLEQRRAGEAFGRSRELVRGYGWGVFGVIVLTILIIIGINIALGLALLPFDEWLQTFLSNVVGGTVTAPFIAVTWTLLYYRLRGVKEAPAAPAPTAPAS